MRFSFLCRACGETHTGMPSFGADAPWLYEQMAPAERATRCQMDSDACIVDEEHCFVRATIDIPVHGADEPFSWGVWVSLSGDSFDAWDACFHDAQRSHIGPFSGWLSTQLPVYPATLNLKTRVHLRDDGVRPSVELEPTDHPLAVEQREGITVERVAELYARLAHGAA